MNHAERRSGAPEPERPSSSPWGNPPRLKRRPRPKPHRGPAEHWLLSVYAGPIVIHGYLICPDQEADQAVQDAVGYMMNIAEQHRLPLLGLTLATKLTEHPDIIQIVQDDASKRSPEAARLIAEVGDFCFTAWALPMGDPDNSKLLDLH
jgi:hypothetical protein